MKIIKLQGGLGNQMFQYAFGKAVASLGQKIYYDISWYSKEHKETARRNFDLEVFNVNIIPSSKWQKFFCKIVKEKNANVYEPELRNRKGNVYYSGYFQSEGYFKDFRPEIIKDFSLKYPITDDKNLEFLQKIRTTNSVSMHIRRGDYVKLSHIYGLCSPSYYQKAAEYIQSRVSNPHFYIFSDDMAWVKENLKIKAPCDYVDINTAETAYLDMELMRNCRHNIIANSSFSWWGAWLNANPQKIVICPDAWYADNRKTDIVPPQWIRLET